jgi:bla regulator protein BlaR1
MIALIDHLWQSTLCVVVAWLLTLALNKNSARIRHWIWLVASTKFLVPFSLLIGLGSQFDLGWHNTSATVARESSVVVRWSRPFATPASSVFEQNPAADSPSRLAATTPYIVVAAWLVGFGVVALYRQSRRLRLRKVVGEARLLRRGREVEALDRVQFRHRWWTQLSLASSNSTISPGVHGIFDPVLLLPAGIADRLTDAQLEAIVTHELAHLRRRDNVTAALQVAVETIFWFHPLVWWIGARLVDERERACDEHVLQLNNDPQEYAGAILKVCEFYLVSPLSSVPGIMGSNLSKRIEDIMINKPTVRLNFWRKVLLALAGMLIFTLPILLGSFQNSPSTTAGKRLVFEVASIRPHRPGSAIFVGPAPPPLPTPPDPAGTGDGPTAESSEPGWSGPPVWMAPGGRLTAGKATVLDLVRSAYSSRPGWPMESWLVSGGADWTRSAYYDIDARAEGANVDQMVLMLQSLLTDRFNLRAHWETRELPVYELMVANGGLKLQPWTEGSCIPDGQVLPTPAPLPPPPNGNRISRSAGWAPPFYCDIFFSESNTVENLYAGKKTFGELLPFFESKVGRTIIDKTGFTRPINAHLEYELADALSEPEHRNGAPPAAPSFSGALQEVGLKLESRKGRISVLVIDSVDRPTEN